MSLTMSIADPFSPSRFIIRRMRSCGTDPNASLRSSHARSRLRLLRLASSIMDLSRKLCSAQPSYARKPFWAGEKALVSMAQEAILLAMMAVYSLYRVSCRQIGRQFRTDVTSPPLWMRVTVECFHSRGILALILQALYMVDRIRPWGSTYLQLAYVMPSAPGAVRFALLSWKTTSSGVTGGWRTSPSLVVPVSPVSSGCLSGNVRQMQQRSG